MDDIISTAPNPISRDFREMFAPLRDDALPRGTEIGRFVLLDRLGAGAMGVVYAAYDPELNRKVALKLLTRGGNEPDDALRARLLREAQALARLTHPNVVAVHEVHTHARRVWIAMEYVAGQTLSAWAQTRPRQWPEVLQVLTDAARGVAAAHAAGVVHRDLKPDNVMIGSDERVRVMDFGLAHGRGTSTTEQDLADTRSSGTVAEPVRGPLATRLTQTGAIPGTPAYMAPEQWNGIEAGAPADQFAWSVMAWELLYGERPFAGETAAALSAAVLSGQRRPPSRGHDVPTWLRRVIERGLATDPSRRWPSMEVLLTALTRGAAKARAQARLRWMLGAASGLLLIAASAWIWVRSESTRWAAERDADTARRVHACKVAGAEIDSAWNENTRRTVVRALLATGVSNAPTTVEKLLPWLDRYALTWNGLRTEACLNTSTRALWSAEALNRSLWCFDDRRLEFESLVNEFSQADGQTVQKSVPAAARLSRIEPCVDMQILSRLPTPPTDQREIIRAIRVELSRITSLERTGHYDEGLTAAQATMTSTESLGWSPIHAAARAKYGVLLGRKGRYEEAVRELEDAYFEAMLSGALDTATDASMRLISLVGERLGRLDEGVRWARHAEIALKQLGEEEGPRMAMYLVNRAAMHRIAEQFMDAKTLHTRALAMRTVIFGAEHPSVADSLNDLGLVNWDIGKYEEAAEYHKRALTIQEALLGREHPDVTISLNNLGNVYGSMGKYEESKLLHERSVDIKSKTLGLHHPDTAVALNNLAAVYERLGNYADAARLFERALVISRAAHGDEHPNVATTLSNIAGMYYKMGEYQQAETLLVQALAIKEKTLGPDNSSVAVSLEFLGNVHYDMGHYREAQRNHERALAIRRARLGPGHREVGDSLCNLANVHLKLGALAQAKFLYQSALAIHETALSTEHPVVAHDLWGISMVYLWQHDAKGGLPYAERALRLREAAGEPPHLIADSRFVLARLLWNLNQDRPRAIELARAARLALRNAKPPQRASLSEIEAWLAKRRIDPG